MRQTITQLLQSAYRKIDKLDTDLLLSFVLGKPREYFIIHGDETINAAITNKFNKLVKKRKTGVPLAYLTLHKEFFGLDFLVNKHTLIPRPDTEILVEQVIETINKHTCHSRPRLHEGKLRTGKPVLIYNQPPTFLDPRFREDDKLVLIDVGTGSGCIPISILKNIKEIKTFAIDISKKALIIARKNAKKHGVKIKFLHGNLLQPFLNSKFQILNSSVIITANLPYLTEKQYKKEKSIKFEPKSALVAKKEGMALYEKLLNQVKQLTNLVPSPYNLVPIIYLEIDPSQSEKITVLINKILPKAKIAIKKDISGCDRVVIITQKI